MRMVFGQMPGAGGGTDMEPSGPTVFRFVLAAALPGRSCYDDYPTTGCGQVCGGRSWGLAIRRFSEILESGPDKTTAPTNCPISLLAPFGRAFL